MIQFYHSKALNLHAHLSWLIQKQPEVLEYQTEGRTLRR